MTTKETTVTTTPTPGLPVEPTYGWLDWTQPVVVSTTETSDDDHSHLITEHTEDRDFRSFGVWEPVSDIELTNGKHTVHITHITAFTPAEVTPTKALAAAVADTGELDAQVVV